MSKMSFRGQMMALILFGTAVAGCFGPYGFNRQVPRDAQGVPMLKDIYSRDFLIGTAMDYRSPNDYSPIEIANVKAQYNIITPENSMKPINTQPQEGRWTFAGADALVDFCEANGIKVWGHTLVWHAQTPNWFFQREDGEPVAREKALERMKTHIQTVVSRYRGRVMGWDVVNEAIDDSPNGATENLRRSQWLRTIGPEFITYAFKFAREADPDVELYYNDYNIESGAKHKSSLLLLKRLIRDGAPITGVGIQGHWGLNHRPYKELDQAIKNYKALGLKVSITELDITITGTGGGQFGPAPGTGPAGTQPGRGFGGRGFGRGGPSTGPATAPTTAPGTSPTTAAATERALSFPATTAAATTAPSTGPAATGPAATGPATTRGRGRGFGFGRGGRGPSVPPTPQQLNAQATAYAEFFKIFQKHKGVIDRVTFWGINDRRSWRPGQNPLLFDNDNKPKPAIESIARTKR